MTALYSVELLPPGSRPTEPGWYVARTDMGFIERDAMMVCVFRDQLSDRLLADVIGGGEEAPFTLTAFTFIARIYPDRIGQE